MAFRMRRTIKLLAKILMGVFVALVLIIGAIAAYLAWWPEEPPALSSELAPPEAVSASGGRGYIAVEWSAVPGALCYRVSRGESPAGPFRPLSPASGPTSRMMARILNITLPGFPFHLTPRPPLIDTSVASGRLYFYRVAACEGELFSKDSQTVAASSLPKGNVTVNVRVEAAREIGPIERTWEVMLGSEHLSYMLTGDLEPGFKAAGDGLRKANKRFHDEFGVQFIRAHGIFMDDLGTYREDARGNPVYDWTGIDKVYDMLIADGLKPFVELSFMPTPLAFDPDDTIFFYRANTSPPKDYGKWSALVAEFARHLIDRYGREEVESWYFEVWNEPDLKSAVIGSFWHGTDEEYFHLYDVSARALKQVDPKLRVGGPAAASLSIVDPFLRHVTADPGSPLDFLSVHAYFVPVFTWKPILEKYNRRDLPVFYTEWGVSPRWGEAINDMPYGAAWLARALIESSQEAAIVSYWTASDYFEELGPPKSLLHGGFGLLGLEEIRKPRYWAFHLLHSLGDRRLHMQGSGDGFGGHVQGWAASGEEGSVRVLLCNVSYDQTRPEATVETSALMRHIALGITGLPPGRRYLVRHYRVDDAHSNVYAAWKSMGQPAWPDARQLAELRRRDSLELMEPESELAVPPSGNIDLKFDLPMPALSQIELIPLAPDRQTAQ